MRSAEEVQEFYDERELMGEAGKPYVLHYEAGDSNVIFFGSVRAYKRARSHSMAKPRI